LQTTLIAGLGGVLGVLFTIPLRRALIVNAGLEFPEGVATAQVLHAGQSEGGGMRAILGATLLGAFVKLGETGLRLWVPVAEGARHAAGTVLYFGANLSPALAAVGYIVGLNIAVLVFAGGAINWLLIIPAMVAQNGAAEGISALAHAQTVWSEQTRYIGVGAMVVGGLWALVNLRGPLAEAVRSGLAAYRTVPNESGPAPQTERDLPM
ncbi:unnamed protein product, partial [Laminaria digitata]